MDIRELLEAEFQGKQSKHEYKRAVKAKKIVWAIFIWVGFIVAIKTP